MMSKRQLWFAMAAILIIAGVPFTAAAGDLSASRKPLIGINMDVNSSNERPATATARLLVPTTYVDAVTRAGGVPIVLPPVASRDDVRRLVAAVDGIVLIGGGDITPARYGQAPHEKTALINPRREHFDFLLIEEALRADKPILGVCLGMQELNVATGGQMIQDIEALTDSIIDHRPKLGGDHLAHDVSLVEGTRLQALAELASFPVNSMHHQACVNLGEGVIVSARAPDGTIEGIEVTDRAFAIGVQWHPEHLTDSPEHLGIFKGLVEAARAAMNPAAMTKPAVAE